MPTPWASDAKRAGKLKVLNKAGAWSRALGKAMQTFNGLALGVTLEAEKDETKADIVVALATGAMTIPYKGHRKYPDEDIKASAPADFQAERLHGLCHTVTRRGRRGPGEIIFAGIFLPGKAKATEQQREVIIVHEFFHASGLDGGRPDGTKHKGQDHDTQGILYDIMSPDGDKLKENSAEINQPAMPPIRIGTATACSMAMLWQGRDSC